MKINRQSELPYIVSSTLGQATEWIAYPVKVSTKGDSHSSSLKRTKQIIANLMEIANGFETSNCQTMSLPSSGEFEHMQTQVELLKEGKDFFADAYVHVAMKFDSSVQLWEKMEMVARQLDQLTEFSGSFKSDKACDVYVGRRLHDRK